MRSCDLLHLDKIGTRVGGRGQTHRSYDAIRRLMGYLYVEPSQPKKKGWVKRRFRNTDISFPSPICSKTISTFADKMCLASGLEELPAEWGGGAQFDADHIVIQLIDSLQHNPSPSHVHLQIMGDGFRAMKSNIVSVGVRLLVETEQEAGDTSFTAIASL